MTSSTRRSSRSATHRIESGAATPDGRAPRRTLASGKLERVQVTRAAQLDLDAARPRVGAAPCSQHFARSDRSPPTVRPGATRRARSTVIVPGPQPDIEQVETRSQGAFKSTRPSLRSRAGVGCAARTRDVRACRCRREPTTPVWTRPPARVHKRRCGAPGRAVAGRSARRQPVGRLVLRLVELDRIGAGDVEHRGHEAVALVACTGPLNVAPFASSSARVGLDVVAHQRDRVVARGVVRLRPPTPSGWGGRPTRSARCRRPASRARRRRPRRTASR